ncbi:MAG: hypothetical protein C4336_08625, partial [Armatimonadota bacterium]
MNGKQMPSRGSIRAIRDHGIPGEAGATQRGPEGIAGPLVSFAGLFGVAQVLFWVAWWVGYRLL